jgi:diguanylate cyclase (GGDEF)-like protein
MYQLDVLSAFAICGAGSLVGAALVRPSIAGDEAGTEALQICRGAFAAIGVGLVQIVAVDGPPPLWSQAAMSIGGVAGVTMIGWTLAALGGARSSRVSMWLVLAIAFAAMLAALPLGTRGMTYYITLSLMASSTLMTWLGRRVLLRPRDINERLLGATVLMMLISSWLRASFLLTWDGPFEPHLLYVPPLLVTPFALMYGVLPIVFTMLLVNVIGARLHLRLHQRAMTDQLTGALSRHALAEGASMLVARLREGGGRLAVIMVDLDHFKQVNDRHGHAGGDAVLRHAAKVLQSRLRADALLARYGGEEFVVLAPVDDLPVARRVAERMRQGLETAGWSDLLPGLATVTASLGVAVLEADESLEHALGRADEALYRAKNGGRNQVQVGLFAA